MNHMAFFCGLMLAGAVAAPAQPSAQPAADSKPAPKIEFDSMNFNFGKVKAGETVKHDFIFTNTGKAMLEISDVKAGCGCTTAGTWDKQVEPGKTGIIPLAFNSTGFGGQLSKSATVTCNDPAHATLMLQLSGTVWKPIDVTPQMAVFNVSSDAATNETKTLRIVNNLDDPVTLSDLQCNNTAFRTELKEVKPGKEFDLLVTALGPFTSPTVFATITLKTSSTNMPVLTVSAYATVQQAVTVTPQQVMLPAGPLQSPQMRTVQVRNNGAGSFEISDARLDLAGVDLKVTPVETNRVYSILMTFPAGFEIPSGKKLELTFKSTHPKHPNFQVPIIQMPGLPARPAVPLPVVRPGPAPTPPSPATQ